MLIRRRVSIIVQLSVAFTLITSDHLELNRNHMNHVQHDRGLSFVTSVDLEAIAEV